MCFFFDFYIAGELNNTVIVDAAVNTEGNFSADGRLLPCVPETDKSEKDRDAMVPKNIPTVHVPVASTTAIPKTQATVKDIPIVTKLQDNEQIPSEDQVKTKNRFVTLLDPVTDPSQCRTPSVRNNTNPHRMICSFIQTMLNNHISHTCSMHLEPTATQSGEMTACADSGSTETKEHAEMSKDVEESDSVLSLSSSVLTTAGVGSVSQVAKASKSKRNLPQSVDPEKVSTRPETSSEKVQSSSVEVIESHSFPETPDALESKATVPSGPESEETQAKLTPRSEEPPDLTEQKQEEEVEEGSSNTRLEPSSPTLSEESLPVTQTPVLDTEQLSKDVQKTEVNKVLISSKVDPTPASILTTEDMLPTRVSASVTEEELEEVEGGKEVKEAKEVKEVKKASGAKASGTEDPEASLQVVKAQNITDNKNKTPDLVPVPMSPMAKRETAIMRLTNRIKALELNVSLSSRFLDELSHRFKKQSEDMVKLMNKTIQHFNNITNKAEIRDSQQQDQLDNLESRIENLTTIVSELAMNMDNLTKNMMDRQLLWTTMEFLFLVIVGVVVFRRGGSASINPEVRQLLERFPPLEQHVTKSRRRNSIGSPSRVVTPSTIRKQSSDTALATLGASHSFEVVDLNTLLLNHQSTHKDGNKKKKKKKHKNLESKSREDNLCQDSVYSTKLNETAGLLFGADAVTVLTGCADPQSTDPGPQNATSTTSLPTHSRENSQSFEMPKPLFRIPAPMPVPRFSTSRPSSLTTQAAAVAARSSAPTLPTGKTGNAASTSAAAKQRKTNFTHAGLPPDKVQVQAAKSGPICSESVATTSMTNGNSSGISDQAVPHLWRKHSAVQ